MRQWASAPRSCAASAPGKGEEVATSLVDGMVANLAFLSRRTTSRPASSRCARATTTALVAPYGLFEAADGQVAIAPSNDQVYFKLLDALGLSHLRDHPEFATNARPLRAARTRSTRSSTPRSRKQPDRALARRAERGRRAVRPRDGPAPKCSTIRRSATSRCRSRSTIRVHGTLDVLGFPIKFTEDPCRVHRAAAGAGRRHRRDPARARLQRRRRSRALHASAASSEEIAMDYATPLRRTSARRDHRSRHPRRLPVRAASSSPPRSRRRSSMR